MISFGTADFYVYNQSRPWPMNEQYNFNNCNRDLSLGLNETVSLEVTLQTSVRNSAGTPAILTWNFHGFTHSFQVNT